MKKRIYVVLQDGREVSLQEAAKITGISYSTLYKRMARSAPLFAELATRPLCPAREFDDCLDCPYPECVASARDVAKNLPGEEHPLRYDNKFFYM